MNKCVSYLESIVKERRKGVVASSILSFLILLSYVYLIVINIRRLFYKIGLYKTASLSKPVVSVGNIVLGGTGKTPMVAWIAQYYLSIGKKPVILTRGYMAKSKTINSSQSDEAMMLQETLPEVPILVGKNRFDNAQIYLNEHHADIFILDDGFQHFKIHRDLDIVLLNEQSPLGTTRLIPAGTLRENKQALKRADLLVVTKSNQSEQGSVSLAEQLAKTYQIKGPVYSGYEPHQFVSLKNSLPVEIEAFPTSKSVCTINSIAEPESFRETLRRLDFDIVKSFDFPDHYVFTEDDFKEIYNFCINNNINTIMCTHKDAVKLKGLILLLPEHIAIFMLKIKLKFHSGRNVLTHVLNDILDS